MFPSLSVRARTETDGNMIFDDVFWIFSKFDNSVWSFVFFSNTLKHCGSFELIRLKIDRQSSEIRWRTGRTSDVKNVKNLKIFKLIKDDRNYLSSCTKMFLLKKRCSTSLPGGNQVDGLPPALSFENFNFHRKLKYKR